MKRMLFAGAVALVATTPAFAADLIPPPGPPPQAPATYVPTIAPIYNWGGIYVGLNGGYGFGDSNWGAPASTGNFDVDGGLFGATLGFNYQVGSFVFGVEGDGDWTDIKGSAGAAVCPGTCQTSNEWLATLRGRVGYAIDRVLVYGTAGGAGGNIKGTLTTPVGTVSSDSSEFGWTAGAGVEFAITENLTAKVEYLFVDLSNGSLSCSVAVCGATTSVPVSFDSSLIRAGLNFKFNPF
ncbi:MAG: outer membrane protein [Xanthobacteraceae bacterium]